MSDRLHHEPATASFPAVPLCSAQLDREWQHLRRNRPALRAARAWAGRVEPDLAVALVDLADLQDLIAATQRDAGERGERVLLALVELARADQLAGRVIVQRLLPGLISASGPQLRWIEGVDPIQLAVGALWVSVRSYDTARRRRHVAASLISDAVYRAFRQPRRKRTPDEDLREPVHFEDWTGTVAVDPLVELAGTLDEADRIGVPCADTELLRRLVRSGSPRRVAEELGVTTRTVRNRRERAVRRVRAAVAAADPAA